ncbi:MAG: peptidylprolyl isomerase [Chloroflexi bacterium]|nr:peptidylprolyl isomerase [Chloroflexota bacterium]
MPGCNAWHNAAQAKNGDVVQVDYTGKLADGTVFDTSVGREPLEFTLGAGQMITGFEKAVLGMKVGEKKTVTIPADEAYGPRRDDLVGELPREKLPSGLTPEVGQQLQMTRPDGGTIIATITNVSDNTVTIDANPPLAGKDLTFEIELVKIQ